MKRRRGITPEALRALSRYPFPGNVRELLNLVERLMVTTTSDTIDVGDLPRALLRLAGEASAAHAESVPTLRKALQKVVTQSTVARKAKQYGLKREGHAS